MTMTKAEQATLTDALGALAAFLDVNDSSCTVSRETREQARVFLDSWVGAPLALLLSAQTAERGGSVAEQLREHAELVRHDWLRKGKTYAATIA